MDVEDGVDLLEEDVSHNEDLTELRGEFEAHDAEDALDVLVIDDVVGALESEGVAVEVDVEVGEGGNLVAGDGVAAGEELGGTDHLSEALEDGGRGGEG